MPAKTEEQQQSAVDYLEHAVDDLNRAREEAIDEARSAIDSAITRTRDALDDLRSDAEDRAERFRARAEDRFRDWQGTLEDATEDVRRELGIRAVHAQRTEDALDALDSEIKEHRQQLRTQ